jgi:hypothetical protein
MASNQLKMTVQQTNIREVAHLKPITMENVQQNIKSDYNLISPYYSEIISLFKSRDSSVCIALGYGLDDRGSGVRFPAGLGIFLLTIVSRMALGPTQPPIQWVPGALSLALGVWRPGVKLTTHLPLVPTSENAWSYTSTPQYAFMAWCSSKKAQGQLYFYLYRNNPLWLLPITGVVTRDIFPYVFK